MKIFITGVTGYIGHELMLLAVKKGYAVNALVRNVNAPQLIKHTQITYIRGDVTDYASVLNAMKGCRAVMHSAGITQLWHKDRSEFYRVNVGGTKNVLEAACYHKIGKFVFTSSCSVLGPSLNAPLSETDIRITAFENDYEVSKYCCEEIVREYFRKGLFAVIVCPSRVYGPGLWTNGNPLTKLIQKAIKRGVALVPSAKNVLGNYCFIDDVVEGHFMAMEKGISGEKYILGGENLSYQEFFEAVKQLSPNKIRLISVSKLPLKIASYFTYASSLLTKKHTHLTPKIIDRIFQTRALSSNKATQHLGYKITPVKQGLLQTIQFLKSENHV